VQRTGERGFEPGQLRAPFVRIDIVGEGEGILVVAVVVLDGEFDLRLLAFRLDIDRDGVDRLTGPAEVIDELDDPALVVVLIAADLAVLRPYTLVGECDTESLVEVGQLSEPVAQGIEGVAQLAAEAAEDLWVRAEG